MLSRFTKDLVIYLPSKLLPALTGFITAPILTRLLTTSEFGSYALAVGMYEFLFALTCSGLGAGAVRFYSMYKAEGRLGAFFSSLGTSVGMATAGGCVGSLLTLVLLRGRLPADLYSLLFISVLIFGVQAAFIVLMQVVRVQERSRLYTALDLMANYGSLGLGLVLLYVFGWGVAGLLWGAFIAFAVSLAVLLALVVYREPLNQKGVRSSDMGLMWRYAWPLAVGNMAMWGLRLADRYLLGIFRSRSEVGLYSAAYNISSKSIDILVAVFLLSMGPFVFNMWEKSGIDPTRRALRSTSRVFLLMCLPAVAGMSVLARPFVALLTDTPYHEGYRIVAFVAFSSFAYGLTQIVSVGLLIAKRTSRIAVNQVLAALANLGLNLALVPRFGFVAAGATTLAGYAALLVLQVKAAGTCLSWPFPYTTLRNTAIASAAMCLTAAGIYALAHGGDGTHVGCLALSVVAAIIVYGAGLVLLGEFDHQEIAAIKHAWSRVTNRPKTAP
jgi:O-antigen/teichoic acid export membrane protein